MTDEKLLEIVTILNKKHLSDEEWKLITKTIIIDLVSRDTGARIKLKHYSNRLDKLEEEVKRLGRVKTEDPIRYGGQ